MFTSPSYKFILKDNEKGTLLMEKILICDPDLVYAAERCKQLEQSSFNPILVGNGKNAQIEAHANRFGAVVIDIKTTDNSSFDFLGYINMNSQGTRVFFSYEDELLLQKLGISEKNSARLGINKLLKKPYSAEHIASYMASQNLTVEDKNKVSEDLYPEIKLQDKHFSETPILSYHSGNISVLDLFLKLGPNKYIKVTHRGDYLSKADVEKLRETKKVEYLYFRTDDRSEYIDQLNNYLKRYLEISNPSVNQVSQTSQTIIDKYIEEIHVKGINPTILEQGKILCENIYNMMKKDALLNSYIEELENGKINLSHVFLTTVFASVITSHTDWASKKSFDYIIQGAILHDIGKLKLPTETTEKNIIDMTEKEKKEYQTHPEKGFDMLSGTSLPHQVKQIIYQHHEWVNGEGYPNSLSGMRIFPLAKIVSFANDFSEYVLTHNISPKAALIDLLPQRNIICRYDPGVIKSFAKAFSNERKKS